jgi:cbb3-type cytochrome oxidase maturation protein
MITLTIILLITTTLLGFIFFALFRWAVKNGQFEDPEEAKYVIFREHESDHADGGNEGELEWEKKKKKA